MYGLPPIIELASTDAVSLLSPGTKISIARAIYSFLAFIDLAFNASNAVNIYYLDISSITNSLGSLAY
jgi:hypothetical protein